MANFSSTRPQLSFVLCFTALAVRVAGQWSGQFNTTTVDSKKIPPKRCWIHSLSDKPESPSLRPCTCTGGTISPDCNYLLEGLFPTSVLLNRVSNSVCKCPSYISDDGYPHVPHKLKDFTESQPQGVHGCLCDSKKGFSYSKTDDLVTSAPGCWCPAEVLKKKSGLSDAGGPDNVAPAQAGPNDGSATQKTQDTDCGIDWLIDPESTRCTCFGWDKELQCSSGQTDLRSTNCYCGKWQFQARPPTKTRCICTRGSEGGKRDRCICSR
ncbi:hypothetical protein CDD83_4854 [Cordyceps sp. RAO-2017]|nr:hypothetical protein CDD83_4854 [Cordyceps sp. RAO-2017]